MSLGVLGGTFDPVHYAHLRLAEEMREALALERVLLIPAAVPPLKTVAPAAAAHRLEMLRRAVASDPTLQVLDLELKREGPSYTVDTLRELHQLYPGERLWFLLGVDALHELGSWREPEALFELASFAVVERPSHSSQPLERLLPPELAARFRPGSAGLEHPSGHELRWVPFPRLEISASEIRQRIARGASVRHLVPDAVIEYIDKHSLYREEH